MAPSTSRPWPLSARRRSGPWPGRVERDEAGETAVGPVIIDVTEETFQAEVARPFDDGSGRPRLLGDLVPALHPALADPRTSRRGRRRRLDPRPHRRGREPAALAGRPGPEHPDRARRLAGPARPWLHRRAARGAGPGLPRPGSPARGGRRGGRRRWCRGRQTPTSTPPPTPWTRATSTLRRRRTTPCSPSAPATPTAAPGSPTVALLAPDRPAQTSTAVLAAAASSPEDVAAQLAAADLEFADGSGRRGVRPAGRGCPALRRSRTRAAPRAARRAVRPAAGRGPAPGESAYRSRFCPLLGSAVLTALLAASALDRSGGERLTTRSGDSSGVPAAPIPEPQRE